MNFAKAFAIWMWIALGALSAILIGFYFVVGIENEALIKLLEASHIGTIIGGATSIFAVYLLYETYLSQKKELRETQNALHQQKIDSAFFEMLSLLQEIIRSMTSTVHNNKGQEVRLNGRDYLKTALHDLQERYLKDSISNMRPNPAHGVFNPFSPSIEFITGNPADRNTEVVNYTISSTYRELQGEVAQMYEEFYHEHQQNLGHYFRYMYNIIKYVIDPTNRLRAPDRERYLGILQAQLSNDEMGLIFYNVLSKHGRTSTGEYRFRNWLDQYGILENIDYQSLKHEWHHYFFPHTMFKFLDETERKRKIEYQNSINSFNISP